MAKLTFYGGVNEIGGNKILLEDEAKIFLDFGKNFDKERRYFDEPYLSPQEEKHLLALGILPEIRGLYKKSEEEPDVDGILLSHPHLDHMDYIRYVKDSIPVCCGEATQTIIKSREFCSRIPSAEYAIANLTATRGRQVFKNFDTFRTGKKKFMKGFEIEPVHVDHSVPAAYGLIVRSPSSTIVYTGDFRFHGPVGAFTQEFVEKAKEATPDALIIEGTNAVEMHIADEKEVYRKAEALVARTSKLVMASFSTVDIDRLRTFYWVAQRNGRRLVVSMRQAFPIDAIKEGGILPFTLKDPEVAIFERRKKRPYEWEKEIEDKYGDNIVKSSVKSKMWLLIGVQEF